MTAHLPPNDLLAAVDGSLDQSQAAHLASCSACQASVAEMRALVVGMKADDVPEPSPLFWDHFSDRVRNATAAEPHPSGWTLGWRVWAMLASSTTAFVLVLAVRHGSVNPAESAAVVPPQSAIGLSPAAGAPSLDTTETEPMAAMLQAASNLSPDDLNSVVTIASDATPLVEDLNPAERAAFVRLLSAEMEKTQ